MQSFLKENGYIWESGIAGHYTYGPLGKALKNSIENYIRKTFEQYDFIEIDTPLILHKDVWVNSGHWDKFKDPMVTTQDGKLLRLDHLLENKFDINFNDLTFKDMYQYLVKYNSEYSKDKIIIPDREEDFNIQYRDLMMKSLLGNQEVGLRPETATATYHNFSDIFQYFGGQIPIYVYQIGKSFRNEVSPKHSIIRGREFTQAEFQIILREKQKDESDILTNLDNIRNLNDIISVKDWLDTYKLPKNYAQYMLITYELFMKLDITFDKVDTLYENKTIKDGKPMLCIPYHLSSIQVGVLPLVKNRENILEKSYEVYDLLKNKFKTNFLRTGSIGKRYLKNSVKGVPYNVTIDHDTLVDGCVTVRDRDTEAQDRIKIGELVEYLYTRLYK